MKQPDYDALDRPHHSLCPQGYGAGECECAELAARDFDDAMDSRYSAWRDAERATGGTL